MVRVVVFAAARSGSALRRRFLAQVLSSIQESALQLLLLCVEIDRICWLKELLLESVHGFAALVEPVDVEVGEVGGRLVQIVVQRATQSTPETTITAAHVQQLLVKLLVRYDLLHGHTSRFSNVK